MNLSAYYDYGALQQLLLRRTRAEGCIEWPRSRNVAGYGRVYWDKKVRLAHRLAYELTNGPIPAGLCVLHKCDHPPCINPDHLFLGTPFDNMQDMVLKGRPRGRQAKTQEGASA